MIIVGLVVAVLVLGGLAAWGVSRADVPGVAAPVSTQSASPLAPGPLTTEDVRGLRFDQAVRGYRMEQVDAALSRLAQELVERDAEITRLRGDDPADGAHDDAAPQPGGSSR
ncbi:DivIVA domain-containing protein [Ornithinimicrobium tianjinense]|uniref:DivIVA domain-containing protein n=1 Tax=Ornithinimicrobium tianjinense TaxID=1195761 RepID=A0A917BWR3_9MICO|nr:DivIVA domain-containing protein [Ornithinimicrobium tianjinense]GGF59625.1 hypothetical protein GCM10011366_29350 [Ornithinimicrobium tianjinense]